MKQNLKFLICKHCGNMVSMIHDAGVEIICCGEPMKELVANTTEAATEKHIPEVKNEGSIMTVTVGSVIHPMIEEHHIEWIYLQTDKGGQIKMLKPGESPTAKFALVDEKAVAVYEYCNIHGLWKIEL